MKNVMERYHNLLNLIRDEMQKSSNATESRLEAFNNLISFLETDTDWLTAPASTKYHNSFKGGLLCHSISVTEIAYKTSDVFAPDIDKESILLTGLLHDCGKCGQYIMKEPTEKQKQYGYPGSIVYNNDIVWMEHEARSIKLITAFMPLTDYEFAAILYHNEPQNGGTHSNFKRNRLMSILQFADYWATLYAEEGSGSGKDI